MKLHYVAAASLLLGTSALAWAPSSEPVAESGAKTPVMTVHQGDKAPHPVLVSKSNEISDVDKAAWLKTAALEDETLLKSAKSDWDMNKGLVRTASSDSWEMDEAVKTASVDDVPSDLDLAETPADYDKAGAYAGMGGPLEVDQAAMAATSGMTPQPATRNYPPCDPGPGDDNCIQLYEPGVRTALASWNNVHGGLMEHQATTAMGGPYEPVTDAYASSDAAVDHSLEAMGENMADATQAYQGMGGPTRETGYPACSSTVTDRCIQLYERGVTGQGN
jgi:hypothetical protein